MKNTFIYKIIITFITIHLSLNLSAQGNLQFNQVLTYTGTIQPLGDSPVWVVPSGKVWKITSKTPSVSGNSLLFAINVNNVPVLNHGGVQNGVMWLNSGDSVKYTAYSYSSFNYWPYFLSILEFNVTP